MSSLLRAARQIMRASARAHLPPRPPPPTQMTHAVCRAKPAAPFATFAVSPCPAAHRSSAAIARSFSTVRETPPPQPFASSAAAIEHAAAAARGLSVTPSLHPHPLPSAHPPSDPAAPEIDSSTSSSSEVRRVVVLSPSPSGSDPLNLLRALKKTAAGPSADPNLTVFTEERHPDARINGYSFCSRVARAEITSSGGAGLGSRAQLQLSFYRSWPHLDFARARIWDRCSGARLAILIVDALSGGMDPLCHSEILAQAPRDWQWIVLIDRADHAPPHKLAEMEEDARAMLVQFGFASGAVIRGSISMALSESKSASAAENQLGAPAMRKLLAAIEVAAQSRSPHEMDRGFLAAVRGVELTHSSRSGQVDPKQRRSIVYTHPRSSPSFFTRHADQLAIGDRCDWFSPTGVSWSSDVEAIREEADGSMEITVAGSHAWPEPVLAPSSDPTPPSAAGRYLASSRAVGVECAHSFEAEVYMLSRAEGGRFRPFVHQSRAFVRFGSLPAIAAASASSGSADPSLPPALEGVVQILPPAPVTSRSDLHRPPDRALCAGHNLRVRLMLRHDAVVAPDLTFALMDSVRGGRVLAVGAVTRPLSRLGPDATAVPLPPLPLRSRLSSWFHSFCGVFYALIGWWLGPMIIGLMIITEGLQIIFYSAVALILLYAFVVWLPEQDERQRQQQQKAEEAKKKKQEQRWSWLRGGGAEAASATPSTSDSASSRASPAAASSAPAAATTPSAHSPSSSDSNAESTKVLLDWAVGWLNRKSDEQEAAEAKRNALAAQDDPKSHR